MAQVVTRELTINADNVKSLCSANGLGLSQTVTGHGKKAFRLYINGGKSGYGELKDSAKEQLFPTATATPYAADLKLLSAVRQYGSTNNKTQGWINYNGTEYIRTNLTKEDTDYQILNVTDSAITTSTRASTIRVHHTAASTTTVSASNAYFKLYFYQYSAEARIGNGANTIKRVSVSDASPYHNDPVTFSVEIIKGSTWHGWYSDEACTQLVSTDQSYTTVATSDITLYAKATTDAEIYACSAIVKSEISSVSVSDPEVVSGVSVTFTAVVNTGCTFEGWYADEDCAQLISADNPYTQSITANTILYAKAHRNNVTMTVGAAEHGTATVSSMTVPYGSDVSFTFTPEDETWELYGWYSDVGLSQLVSEDNPYTFTATEDVTLYPKVGIKRYTITVGQYRSFTYGSPQNFEVISFYYDRLTKEEVRLLRTGEFDSIDQSKVIEKKSAIGNSVSSDVIATILCPFDAYIAIYEKPTTILGDPFFGRIKDSEGNFLTHWPYYWYQPSEDAFFETTYYDADHSCSCSAIAKDGIDYAYATTPTHQEQEAIFTAEVSPGYIFSGWYSNEACTRLVSTDNPAYVTTPKYISQNASATSVTLYAKATPNTASTGLYFKQNGIFVEATAVYKKVNGTWAEQDDPKSLFLGSPSGSESNYIYCGDL